MNKIYFTMRSESKLTIMSDPDPSPSLIPGILQHFNRLGSVWFGDGLGPSLISGLGQTQFHVWLLGWVGSSFLFGCKNKVGWSDSISHLDGGMRVDQGIWSPSW